MMYIFLIVNFLFIYSVFVFDNIQVGQDLGNVNVNLFFVIMFYLVMMMFIGLLMVMVFMNIVVLCDYSVKYDQIFFVMLFSKWGYLGGCFFGVIIVVILLVIGIYLVIFLVGYSFWWVDVDQVGFFYFGVYFNSFLLLVLFNMFFIGVIIFVFVVLFCFNVIFFFGVIILLVGYGVIVSLMLDLDNEMIVKLMDFFVINMFILEIKYWIMDDKNSLWLGFSGFLLLNCLIWMVVVLFIFVLMYWWFLFICCWECKKCKVFSGEMLFCLVIGQVMELFKV